jgi:hypothetical protein
VFCFQRSDEPALAETITVEDFKWILGFQDIIDNNKGLRNCSFPKRLVPQPSISAGMLKGEEPLRRQNQGLRRTMDKGATSRDKNLRIMKTTYPRQGDPQNIHPELL